MSDQGYFLKEKIKNLRERQKEFNARMMEKGIDMTWKEKPKLQERPITFVNNKSKISQASWLQDLL